MALTMRQQWNWSGAEKLRAALRGGANMDELLRDVATIYLAYLHRRYVQQSRGGEWAPLAPATLSRRRVGRRAGASASNVAILRDRGLLLNALNVGASGNLLRQTGQRSVRFGFGEAKHDGDGPSFQQLAAWHDSGTSRMPARRILVLPDERTARVILRAMRHFVQRSTKPRRR